MVWTIYVDKIWRRTKYMEISQDELEDLNDNGKAKRRGTQATSIAMERDTSHAKLEQVEVSRVKIHCSTSVHDTNALENELVINIKTDVRQQICF
jgi:hypothetical protein